MITKTISQNNLFGSYRFKYLNKCGEVKSGKLLVGIPIREPEWFSCRIMIEGQFKWPKPVLARSSFQATHFAYLRLADYLKVFIEDGELTPIPVNNFDECSSKKKINLFEVLATQPDYESLCARRNSDPGSIDFTNVALEEILDFKAKKSRSTLPMIMHLAVPVQRKKLWYCSYYISGVMTAPVCVASKHSLNAVSLALRELYIKMKEKTEEGTFFVRTFHNSRSLEEFNLDLCFRLAHKS